jgi:hypothetical protein
MGSERTEAVMRCEQPCFDYLHRGGRCLCGTNASRAVFGMAPLDDERADAPLDTPEDAESRAHVVGYVLCVLATLGFAAVAIYFS